MILIWIALGGGLGSVLRYLLSTRIDQLYEHPLPIGILVTNIIGSFLIALLAWVLANNIHLSEQQRAALLVGLLGGFTTFASFSYDTLQHFMRGEYLLAALNIVLSVVLCIMAAGAGLLLARSLFP